MADKITRRITVTVDGRQVENNMKAVRKAYWDLNKQINQLTVGSEEYNKTAAKMRQLDSIYKGHRDNLRNINKSQNVLTSSLKKYVGVAAAAFTTQKLIAYGKELFNLAADMDTVHRQAEILYGDAYPKMTIAAEDNAIALGMSGSEYLKNTLLLGKYLKQVGFATDEVADMSSELTKMSAVMSEWSGGAISITQSNNNLNKALDGSYKGIKKLGIALTEEEVQARLTAKGLDDLTGSQKEQALVATRMELINEKMALQYEAFEEGTRSLTSRQKELSAEFNTAKENLATALIPVFDDLMEAAVTVTRGITSLSNSLSQLIGNSETLISTLKTQRQRVIDLDKELGPLIENYEKLQNPETVDEQEALNKIIAKIAKTAPHAITQVDEYGNAIDISTDKVRTFIKVEKERSAQMEERIKKEIKQTENLVEHLQTTVDNTLDIDMDSAWNRFFYDGVLEGQMDKLGAAQKKLADLRRTLADEDTEEDTGTSGGGGVDDDDIDEETEEEKRRRREQAAKEAERKAQAAKRAAEAYEKSIIDLQNNVDQLNDSLDLFERSREIADMDEDDAELAKLDDIYSAQLQKIEDQQEKIRAAINIARRKGDTEQFYALDRQYTMLQERELELQADKQKALDDLIEKQTKEAEERHRAQEEADFQLEMQMHQEKMERFKEMQEEIQEIIAGNSEMTLEQSLSTLEYYYSQLLLDSTLNYERQLELIAEYYKKREEIEESFKKGSIISQADLIKERLSAVGGAFASLGEAVTESMDESGEASRGFIELQKGLAIAQLAIDTASAISSIVKAAAASPDPITLAIKLATGLGTVLANMAKAKKLLASATVPQAAEGGRYKVVGEDDRRTYNASYSEDLTSRYITTPTLLAGERGEEYIINNTMLQDPMVANFVDIMEAMQRKSVPQFAEGGRTSRSNTQAASNAGSPLTPQADGSQTGDNEMLFLMREILRWLRTPPVAVVEDSTLIDIEERIKKMDKSSGGLIRENN